MPRPDRYGCTTDCKECRVLSPPDTLLQLKTENVTKQASQLTMHTRKCDLRKAHCVASRPPAQGVEVLKTLLGTDFKRVSATHMSSGNILTAVAEETETAQETAGRHGRRRRPALTRMQETGYGQPKTSLSLCTKCVFKIS